MSLNFAGVSSDSVNVVVERYPARPVPSRHMDVIQIPGRSGDLVYTDGAFSNITQTYEVYIRKTSADTFQKSCRKAAEWLLYPEGYQELYDSYDPDTYRLGYYTGPFDVTNALNQFGRASITFNCKPWRYLNTGKTAQTITNAQILTNPTKFTALPKIVVYGSGAGNIEFVVGGYTTYNVAISSIDNGMIIDSDAMDCYRGTYNRNSLLTLTPAHEFPVLAANSNITVFVTGGITSIELTPNWRTL